MCGLSYQWTTPYISHFFSFNFLFCFFFNVWSTVLTRQLFCQFHTLFLVMVSFIQLMKYNWY